MDPCKKGMEERRYNEMLQQLQQQLISYRESTNSKLFRIEETLQSLVQEMRGIPVDKGVKEHEGFVNPSAKVNHEADRKEMSADSSTHLNLRFPKYDSEKSLTDSIDVYEGAPVFDEDPQEEECDAGEQQLILALGLQTQHSEGPPVFDEDPNKEDHDLEEQKIILALELFDESSKKEEVNEERALAEKYAVQGFSTTYFFVEGVHKPDYGQRTKNGIVTWIKKKVRPGIYTRTTAYDIWRAMGGRWKISEIQLSSFTFLLLLLKVQGHCLLNSEGLALLAFRAAVESDPQGAFLDWNSNDCNPCMWSGVHCVDSQVQMLNLNGLSLEGILAPDLGKPTHLRILILSQNHFSGCIPKEFGGLAMLEIMDLRNNSLNGMITAEIVGMPSLKCLLLHNNKFEGIVFPQNRNIDMSSKLQSDGNYVSGTAAEDGGLNRKFGNCISHCDILSLQKAELLVKPEIFSTQMKETLNCYLHILPSLKSEEGFFSDNTEVFCNDLPSSSEPHLKNQNNIVRCRLTEQSSNLTAAPASGASAVEPIIALPSTRSSGSFPAVPKEKKKPSLAPAPAEPPQVPDHGIAQPGITNYNGGGHSDDKWKYLVGICVAVFVALVAIVLCIVCRIRAKNIGPWRTGLSGQLQKAFVTGVPKLNRYELETACEDFSKIIETHSCCTIYKGTLSSGVEICVTSTSIATRKEWSKRSEIAYRKQIASLSRIIHKNFVNLIGFCAEDEPFVTMMVFESDNEQFVTELSKWVFHERGHLRAVNVRHNKVGESEEPAMYTINDELEYFVEIYEWSGTRWESYVSSDVQLYMMSPHVLQTLSTDQKGLYHSSMKGPDVYGILLRWFILDFQTEIVFKGENLQSDSAEIAVDYCGDVSSRISSLIGTREWAYLWMLITFGECARMLTGEYLIMIFYVKP